MTNIRLIAGILLLALTRTALAEPGGEGVSVRASVPELVVTARKWAEDPFAVPQSVTLISETLIRDAGLTSISEASLLVPNLNMVEFSARRLSFPFVRGIGSGQGEPAVTTYLDGVPLLFGGGSNFPLLDVRRIEYLRGPQATLYGRNALGGVIHVTTGKPPFAPEFRIESRLGNHGLREFRLIGGAPIVPDRLSASVAGLLHLRDGYTLNDYTRHRVDDRETWFGQAQLLFTPDDRNEFRFRLQAERSRDGGFVLSDLAGLRARPHHINQDFSGVAERDVYLPSLTFTHAGDSFEFTSITSYQDQDILETSDFDFSALDGVRRRTEESNRAFTQECRVSSAPDHPLVLGEDAEVRWLAGFLYFEADSDRSAANEFRPGGVGIVSQVAGTDRTRGDFDDRGLGVFGQATVTLFTGLEVGAGLRYDAEWKDADLSRTFRSGGMTLSENRQSFDEDYSELLPRFDVAYGVSPEVRVYALAAKSFKAGGFNLDAPVGLVPFSPETSWTYEGGLKTTLLDGRLRINAAYYYVDWEDMQLSRFDAAVGGYVTNAGESSSHGVEVEVTGRPIEGIELFANCGSAKTEFDSYVDQYGADVSGNRLPFAPRSTVSVGAQLSGDLSDGITYLLRGEYFAVGSFTYDPGNRESERYGLANFRAGLSGEHWSVTAWVRNAFEAEYVPVAFQPNPADPTTFVGESGAPRTWGFTLSLEF